MTTSMVTSPDHETDSGILQGFRNPPFMVANPQLLFAHSAQIDARNQLLAALRQRCGLAVLTGDAGTGKTSLLRQLIDEAPSHVSFLFCPSAHLGYDDLLQFIIQRLSLADNLQGRAEQTRAILRYLSTSREQGNELVLMVDDAHNLAEYALGHLLTLVRHSRHNGPGLQLILGGSLLLEEQLVREAVLHPLVKEQRHCRLEPLTEAEVATYVRWHLKVAGADSQHWFPPAVIQRLYRYSRGLPRRINTLGHRALLLAQRQGQRQVSVPILAQIADEQGWRLNRDGNDDGDSHDNGKTTTAWSRRHWLLLVTGTTVTLLVTAAGALLLDSWPVTSRRVPVPTATDLSSPLPLPRLQEEQLREGVNQPPTLLPSIADDRASSSPDKPPLAGEPRLSGNSTTSEALAEGLAQLQSGDVVEARHWLRVAAEQGDARAMAALGQSFDPVLLGERGQQQGSVNAQAALLWYRRALAAGDRSAATRLEILQNKLTSSPE